MPRLPTAVLSTGLMLLAFLSLASGSILDTVTRGRWELKRLAYLAIPGPQDMARHERNELTRLSGRAFLRFAAVGHGGYFVDAGALATLLAHRARTNIRAGHRLPDRGDLHLVGKP